MAQRGANKSSVAEEIFFNDPDNLYNTDITSVSDALSNIRRQRVTKQELRDSDSESSHSLTFDDVTFHSVIGSGSGYFVAMPDATTCLTGQEFEVYNGSSNPIEIRDDGSNQLLILNSGDLVRLALEDKSTANGSWLQTTNTTTAEGIQSYSVGSPTTFTTSSTTDILITGISVTPVSGRYGLWFSADVAISANNKTAQTVIFQDGVALERTRRDAEGVGSNFNTTLSTVAEVTVDGTEVIDVRVNVSGGSLDVNGRRLLLIRLGS